MAMFSPSRGGTSWGAGTEAGPLPCQESPVVPDEQPYGRGGNAFREHAPAHVTCGGISCAQTQVSPPCSIRGRGGSGVDRAGRGTGRFSSGAVQRVEQSAVRGRR